MYGSGIECLALYGDAPDRSRGCRRKEWDGDAAVTKDEKEQLLAGGMTAASQTADEISVEVTVEKAEGNGTWTEVYSWKADRENSVYLSSSKSIVAGPGYYRVRCVHRVNEDVQESCTDAVWIGKERVRI